MHNLATAYYAFNLEKWYLSMGVKNMHAVEECEIGNIYDKAKYHKLWDYSQAKIFYYTRPGGALNNLAEMVGTRNLFYWLLPVPHFGRQYSSLHQGQLFEYMRFDRVSMKELVKLQYTIETKVEEDLLKSGFKLRSRVQIPQYITQMVGKID